MGETQSIAVMNWLALVRTVLTHTRKHTDGHSTTHIHTQSRGSGRANSIFLSSRQIQFSSRTYVSWLKQPTKTGEMCHILQDWTQYWVLPWQWDAYFSFARPSLSKSMRLSLVTLPPCPSWCHHASHFFLSLAKPIFLTLCLSVLTVLIFCFISTQPFKV